MCLKKTIKFFNFSILVLFSTFFYSSLSAATAVAGFSNGAIGEYTNTAHKADTLLSFSTLNITEAIITQESDDGSFGGTQGNDYDVTLTLRYSNGTSYSFDASVNWRDTQGSTLKGIGLIVSSSSIDDGSGYTLSAGHDKTYILATQGFSYSDGSTVSGNAATNGLLDALNLYVSGLSASSNASPSRSTITADPTSILANGTSISNITVQLKDLNDFNLSSGGDTVLLTASAGTLSSVTDNQDGSYSATLTSSNTVSTSTISGTLNGSNISNTASVSFTADSTAPVITDSTSGSSDVNENQTAVTSFTADESVTWSLSGTDSGLFAISSSGVLTFASAPDYENPADADTNNDYQLNIIATDAASNATTLAYQVNVLDLDDTAPVITDSTSGSSDVNENQTAVTSFTADESVTWSLSGTDSGLFAISSSGVLTFASAPDYENPADADTNNDYQLNIIATDIYDNATTLTLIIKVTNTEEVLIKYQEIESKLQSNLEYEISKSLNNSIFYNESILRGINDKNTCYEDESKTQFRSNNNNLNLNYTDQHLECDKALRLYTNISHITLENLNDKTKTSNASVILEKDISSSSLVGIGIIKSKSDGNLYGFDNSNLQIDTSEIIIYAHKNISESFRGGVYTSFGDVDYRFDFSDSDGFYLTGKTESLRKTYGLILTGDFYLNDRLYTTDFIYNYGKEKIDQTHLNASYLGEAKNNLTLSLNNIASRRISLPLSTTFILDKDNKSEATILSADMSIGALCENSLLTMNEFSCGYQLNVDLEKYFNQNYKDIFYINYIYESVDKWNREVVSLGMINKLGKNNDIEISPSIDFNNQFSSIQFTSFNIGFYFPLRYQ